MVYSFFLKYQERHWLRALFESRAAWGVGEGGEGMKEPWRHWGRRHTREVQSAGKFSVPS